MRTSEEVEAEVEASRNDLDRNVEALKQKMTPGQLFDEAARMMGGTGQQVASRFADQAKANPMPLAVMGLGLAWLMMSNNRQRSPLASHGSEVAYGYAGEPRSFAATPFEEAAGQGGGADGGGMTSALKEKAGAVGDKAKGMLSGVQEKIAHARTSAAEGGRAAGQNLSSMAGTVKYRAGEVGHRAQRTFADTLESEPLLIAGLGVIVGAAIGAALPNTRAEHRLMGEQRDRILGKGKEIAETGMQKASEAAQATYGAVKSELQNQQDDDRPAADRLADAARSGVQAAQEHLQSPPH